MAELELTPATVIKTIEVSADTSKGVIVIQYGMLDGKTVVVCLSRNDAPRFCEKIMSLHNRARH